MLLRAVELIGDFAAFSGIALFVLQSRDAKRAVRQICWGLLAFWVGVAFIAFQ